MNLTRRPRRRPTVLASLLPALVVLAVLGTAGGGLAGAGSEAPLVDLTVTSAPR